MSDEYTAEIRTTPVTTAGELLERLRYIPPQTPVVVQGYEGGYSPIDAVLIRDVQELDRHDEQDYLGRFEDRVEAQRQAALDAADPELAVGGITPPSLVGEPVTAVVLHREGR